MCISQRLILVGATSLVSVTVCWSQTELDHRPSREEVAAHRDLKSYDDGGDHREIDLDAAKLGDLRRFIWDHWTGKKRGYLTLRWIGMDDGGDEHMFLEPTVHGSWHILWRNVKWWVGGDVTRSTVRESPEVTTIERATRKEHDYGGEYVLVFRDKHGKEVKRL